MVHSNDFDAAARELRRSWLVARVGSAANMVALAARHSRILALADHVARAFRSLDPVARLRLILLTIAVAIAAHVLLGQFVSPHVAPLWLAPH
jgi:hypothetical protein